MARLEDDTPRNDEYARRSFTFRRMLPWQIWTLAAVIVVILIAIFAWM
jgi:hypothetical protein